MKYLHKLLSAASAAFFFASAALAQTSGTVTNHAFAIGKGAGQTGYTSLLCGSAQLAVGQSAADPICRTISGDVTLSAAGAVAIGATKVTSAMLNADVFSTAHTWAGQQTFVAPILGAATGTSLALNGAVIGSNILSVNGTTQLVGAATVTSSSASALTVGPNGATNPVFQVDSSGASQATGIKIIGAAAASGAGISVNSSGANESLAINALGTGQLLVNNVATGAITLSRATTLSGALTYGGVTLNNAVTGTGNMVLSSAPTLTLTNATGLPVSTGINGFGTGIATALAVNVGTAGAPVINGGALGSPSSVGTLPAHTLGGTVSGGGNQINNVIVGTSTPLAGFFTTLSGSTSVTSPLRYGGSAVGSTATLSGTSNGSPSSAHVLLQSGTTQFVGINNASPKTTLDINVNTSSSPALIDATSIQRWQNANATNTGTEWVTFRDAAGAGNFLNGVVSAGTSGSPATTANALNMFNLSGYSWNGTAYAKGGIHTIRTASQWTGSNQHTQQDFYVTPSGSTTLTLAMQVFGSTGVGVGAAATDPGAGRVNAQNGFNSGGTAGLSVTKTVRASGGASDCTLIFTGGLLTGGSC